jgi:hypothetical protein
MRYSIAITLLTLVQSANAGAYKGPIPLGLFLITDAGSQVVVTGSWTIPDAGTSGDRIADPINTVQITCDPKDKICNEAIATVVNAANPGKQMYLAVDLVQWVITDWTKQEITAVADALCITTTMSINLVTKEVYKISRNGGISPDSCKSINTWVPLHKPNIAKLVSNEEAMQLDPRTRVVLPAPLPFGAMAPDGKHVARVTCRACKSEVDTV